MSRAVVLDAGTLGMLTHPRDAISKPIAEWYRQCLMAGVMLVVPEIADYELRRKLIHIRSVTGLRRLDAIGEVLVYLPLTTNTMRMAAQLWADMRRSGQPTAPDHALDRDVILAAQARSLADTCEEVVIATDNVGHLDRMVPARKWSDI